MDNLTRSILAALAVAACAATAVTQAPRQFEPLAPLPSAPQDLMLIVTADVDGDGDADVIGTVGPVAAALRLLRNDGHGAFTDVSAAQLPAFAQTIAGITPLDCDGDGDVDLYLNGNYSPSTLLRNDGTGTFTVAGTFPALASIAGAAGDLDGDGDVDLALASHFISGGLNRLLINGGGGTFTPGPTFGGSGLPTVALLDVDRDGDLDVWFAGSRKLLRNDGGLSFTDVTAAQLQVPANVWPTALLRGDVDGDGDGDFVFVAGPSAPDLVVLHQGSALVVGGSLPVPQPTRAAVLADFDRDGDPDLLRAHTDDTMTLARNDGQGTFTGAPGHLPPPPLSSSHLHAADLDGDGDPDVLSCLAGAPATLLQNRDVHLALGAASVGQPWSVELWSQPGYALGDGVGVLAVSLLRRTAPAPLPPFGDLWLDLTNALLVADTIPQAAGRRAFVFPIPAAPQLAGIRLHVQGLVAPATGVPHLTTLDVAIIQ